MYFQISVSLKGMAHSSIARFFGPFGVGRTARLILTLIPVLLTACATMELTTQEPRTADSCLQHSTKNGVTIGISPMTDVKEVKEIFKVDLLSKNVLPILLVAENHATRNSFILAKEKVLILTEVARSTNNAQQMDVASETGGKVLVQAGTALYSANYATYMYTTINAILTGTMSAAGPGGAILILPEFGGMKLASDATVIQHNLADKQLYSRTLEPGQRTQGFVFFQHPEGKKLSGPQYIVVELKDAATGETIAFDFKLDL
jgi:hypothetical protein